MKYISIAIIATIAFVAGSQFARAKVNTDIKLHDSTAAISDKIQLASKWLVSDNSRRMVAYHKALMHTPS